MSEFDSKRVEVNAFLAETYKDLIASNSKALIANLVDFSGNVILDIDSLSKLVMILTGEIPQFATEVKSKDGIKCCKGKTNLHLYESIIEDDVPENVKEYIESELKISMARTYSKKVIN